MWFGLTTKQPLSKLGSTQAEVPAGVFVQDLMTLSIKQGYEDVEEKPPIEPLVTTVPGLSSDWREPFIKYLTIADVPADNTERERLTQRNKHYILVEGKLYHKNAKAELLHKCVSVEDGVFVQKTAKDLNVNGKYGFPPRHLCGKALEGFRSHITEVEGEMSPGS
ncbi:uncharacterized protein [Miscanthus floridulus]|uniref:uncharacterized protein n=1 Tax=Miscanthus floridulus TaxID=154761 RepID=UPI003458EA90